MSFSICRYLKDEKECQLQTLHLNFDLSPIELRFEKLEQAVAFISNHIPNMPDLFIDGPETIYSRDGKDLEKELIL